jgi:hypothetical protein
MMKLGVHIALLLLAMCPRAALGAPPGQGGGDAVASDPACDRDVLADLVTIQDRLDDGRLDAARAYVLDLMECPDGQTEPRLHLALAEIEERLGNLNAAAMAIHLASLVDADDAQRIEAVTEAWTRFAERWVAVKLVAMPVATSDPPLVHSGMVADDATLRCLAELEHAIATVDPATLPSTQWLVPGDYRASGIELRLRPGSTFTIKIAAQPAVPATEEGTPP